MSTVIYLHGYGSSSSAAKAQILIESLGKDRVIVPDLPKAPIEAFKLIWNILNETVSPIIVGSSLGGFYADYFNAAADIPAILINPLTERSDLERFFKGEDLNFVRSRYSDIHYTEKRIAPEYVYLAEDDAVLDFNLSVNNLPETNTRVVNITESGGHRFTNYQLILEGVADMMKVVEGIDFKVIGVDTSRLKERYITATPDDMELKEKLLPIIGPQIDAAYASIGGFVGVPNVQENEKVKSKLMNNTIWKLVRRNQTDIVAGVIYKMSKGRKGIVGWTDGTPQGKAGLRSIIQEDEKMKRAWIEVSGKMERFYSRNTQGTPLPRAEAEILLDAIGKKALKWHDDGYHYDREIQGQVHTKAIYGNSE